MAKKQYIANEVKRTARPRSKRLQDLGVGAISSTILVNQTVSSGGSSENNECHNHANKVDLDKIRVDSDRYLSIAQYEENVDTGDMELLTRKAKVGHSDTATEAITLTGDSKVWQWVIDTIKELSLSKKNPDIAQSLITFLSGLKVGDAAKGITSEGVATLLSAIFTNGISSEAFSPGFDGTGMSITKDANGKWHAEFDTLTIRQLFKVFELVYQKATHVGGMQVVSPAGGTLKKVTSYSTYWRCEYDSTDDFDIDDQILCQTFTGTQKRYWRRITSVGSGYFNLSKSDCETGSGTPSIGDDVAVWGNRTNTSRQSLTVINAYGGSYIRMYNGVNSYSLEGKITSDQSPQNFSVLADIFRFTSGEKVKDLIDGLTTRMTSAEFNLQSDRIWLGISSYMKSSTRNLVLNSGLFKSAEGWIAIGLGSYSNMFLGDNGALHLNILSTNELYNWGHIAATPTLNIEYGKRYCYKVKVQTNSSQFKLAFRDPAGNFFYEKTVITKNSGYNEYYYFVDHNNAAALNLTPLIQVNPNSVSMGTTFSVEYMMLAEATIETDWCPAPEDMEAIIRAGVEVVEGEVRLYGRVIVNGTMIASMIEATGLKIKDANGNVNTEITSEGKLKAKEVEIEGAINAKTGRIGDLIIRNNQLVGVVNGVEKVGISVDEIPPLSSMFKNTVIPNSYIMYGSSPIYYDKGADKSDITRTFQHIFRLPTPSMLVYDYQDSISVHSGTFSGTLNVFININIDGVNYGELRQNTSYPKGLVTLTITIEPSGNYKANSFTATLHMESQNFLYRIAPAKTIQGVNGFMSMFSQSDYFYTREGYGTEIRQGNGGIRVVNSVAQVMRNGVWSNL